MKLIYVAGPYRSASLYCPGQQDNWGIQCNVMRAMEIALEIWKAGAAAICPHANTMFFQHAAPDSVWLEGDLEMLRRCDAVMMAPCWERSSGATAERECALQAGIPVFDNLNSLKQWIHQSLNSSPIAA